MTRYEALAQEIAQAISAGVLRPGDRLPTVRRTCASRGLSPSTVFKAYYLLEARGLIRAAPRSGYFVNPPLPREPLPVPPASQPRTDEQEVSINDLVYDILSSVKSRRIVPLGSAFPSPELFPLDDLRKALVSSSRRLDPWSTVDDLPPGNPALKRQILKRYLMQGLTVPPEDLVLTHGAMEGLNLCVQAVTRPGDAVVVESPCFYAALQALERLSLKCIKVSTSATEGIDLNRLAEVLERRRPKACWLMTNFQNPLGASMPTDKKRELVALLARHEVPLIEDDVYAELHHGSDAPPSAKSFDRHGLVMHCSSFSKCLAPGYRVGWIAAGRFAPCIERLKLMTTLSGSIPTQAALGEYLQTGGFDRHLRRLRLALKVQQEALILAVSRHFPAGTQLTRPQGGYFVWVELPATVDAMALHREALAAGISIAPGPMFSGDAAFRHCIRLNTGHPWTPRTEQAVVQLGRMAHEAL
ncbi:MAG: transcriptional regulator, GntR family [Rhizobacter sp.]|nr:transcriptional regulator, GntR family [Rhizobacter sp.]